MKQKTQIEDLIIQYFFGGLSKEQEDQIEERFLADAEFFERMLSVEDALIDAYVQGELSADERKKVEKFLLPPPRQAREVDFVKNLINDLAKAQPADDANIIPVKSPSRWQSLLMFLGLRHSGKRFSFALMFLITLSLALAAWNLTLQNKIEQIKSRQTALETEDQILRQQIDTEIEKNKKLVEEFETERNNVEQLKQELALLERPDTSVEPNRTATVLLYPNSFLRSGGELKTVRISPGVIRLKVMIEVDKEDDFKSYNAVLKTFDGREIWSKSNLRPWRTKTSLISLMVPTEILTNEDYTLNLKGQRGGKDVIDIGDYSFRVRK